jgi:hypothetical protein
LFCWVHSLGKRLESLAFITCSEGSMKRRFALNQQNSVSSLSIVVLFQVDFIGYSFSLSIIISILVIIESLSNGSLSETSVGMERQILEEWRTWEENRIRETDTSSTSSSLKKVNETRRNQGSEQNIIRSQDQYSNSYRLWKWNFCFPLSHLTMMMNLTCSVSFMTVIKILHSKHVCVWFCLRALSHKSDVTIKSQESMRKRVNLHSTSPEREQNPELMWSCLEIEWES